MPRKGERLSPETRRRMSEARRGMVFTAERRAKISAAKMGHTVSSATRSRIAGSLREYYASLTPEQAAERSEQLRAQVRRWAVLGECVYCGAPANTRDHVLPTRRGGSDDPENIVLACHPCNSSKKGRTPEEWLAGVVVPYGARTNA